MARKKSKPKFLKKNDTYYYLTGESPNGFEGVLVVAWSGIPATESMEPLDRLKGAKEVAEADVPDDVHKALVDAGVLEERAEREMPEEEEMLLHVAAGTDFPTACAASGYLFDKPDDSEPSKPLIWHGESKTTTDGQILIACGAALLVALPIVFWLVELWSLK